MVSGRRLSREWPYTRHKVFERSVREAASVWFKEKGFVTHPRMPYCLSSLEEWKNNIILPEVAHYIEESKIVSERDKAPFPLHKYVHHGLSSQTMGFNLIGPLITRNDYYPLVQLLWDKGADQSLSVTSAVFEYEDRTIFNEDVGQPTSIDIALKGNEGSPLIFVEVKLAEREFGGCSVFADGDCEGKNPIFNKEACFLHFIGRTYWTLMEDYGFIENLLVERQCIFMAHYQFFREVLFSLKKKGVFVLLSDERSPVFHGQDDRGLMPFLSGFVPLSVRSRIISISVQELVQRIKYSDRHADWITEFEKKYGLVKPL